MLTVCFATVCTTEAANDSNVISSDDVVTLDVTKSFRENSEELAKLGITKYKDWAWDDEHECFVLTLDDVHFRTSANVGILFTAPALAENPTVAIKLVGRNSIVSGTEQVVPASIVGSLCAAGILASHVDAAGKQMKDFRVVFIGEGSIVVENDTDGVEMIGSAGIDIYGSLIVAQDATVIAHAGNIEFTVTKATKVEDEKDVYSVGAYVSKTIAVVSQKGGPASLIATGGWVDVYLTNKCYNGVHDLYSEGMSAESYYIINSYVSGMADGVDFGILEKLTDHGDFELYSTSVGISTRDESIEAGEGTHAYISNSKVVGTAYYAEGRDEATSIGIELGDEERIVIEDSILIGVGDIAESNTKNSTLSAYVYTSGIEFYGITDIKSSFIRGISGEQAIVSNEESRKELIGIYSNSDMTVRDSIVIAHAYGLEKQEWSDGISLYYMNGGKSVPCTLNVIDSELYLSGEYSATYVKEIKASTGYWAYSYDTGSKKTITVDDIVREKCLTASIVYKNDVVVVNDVFGVMGFHRTDSNTVVVGPYLGPVPDGMRFAGFFDTDGNEIVIGSTVTLDQVNVVTVAFEHIAEPDNDDNSWIVWVVVIIALVVIALMAAGLYVWKSRN